MAITWTKVTKATGGTVVNITAGEPIGFLLALTYAEDSSFGGNIWTKVTKASGNPWTKVPKAT